MPCHLRAISLHPYLVGVPHRIGALDAALKYICKHGKVWKTTGAEIAEHYVSFQFRAAAAPARYAMHEAALLSDNPARNILLFFEEAPDDKRKRDVPALSKIAGGEPYGFET